MALSQSALSELLEAFRAGEGVDLIRDAVRVALQELIELEAEQVIGADRPWPGLPTGPLASSWMRSLQRCSAPLGAGRERG
jgi:hypothetical protein